MTTGSLLVLDLLAGVLVAAAWLATGVVAALGHPRLAAVLFLGAATATLIQVATAVALAGAGWWFVQDRLTFRLPLVVVAALGAGGLAAPVLSRGARRGYGGAPGRPCRLPARALVALLTAGYAGVAGTGVTYLVGYPLTVGVALLAVALVGLATLVTWRVLVPAGARFRNWVAAAVAAVAVLGVGLSFPPLPQFDLGGGAAAGTDQGAGEVSVDTLRGPDRPAPGGEVRRHTLTAQRTAVALASGRRVDAWTYNGQVPGPAITATEGDLIEVRQRNRDIPDGVTLHWHGYDVPAGEDGAPGLTQDPVLPGEEFTYRFRADQVGTYWYHTHQVSHTGVRKGLFGTLVVTPRQPRDAPGTDLTLPVHTFEGTTVIGDRDRPDPRQVVPGTPVRLRLINTDSTPHRFALAGTPYTLVAIDGRDLHRPGEVRDVALRLPAGGRYDLAFTMPGTPVALLVDDDPAGAGVRLVPGSDEDATVPETSGWAELDPLRYGRPAATGIDLAAGVDRDFTLVLDRGLALVDGTPAYAHTVNGLGHPSIPTLLVSEGDLVRLTVVNRSLATHPWHLHGQAVLVLARDGQAPTGSPLWLDTFDVRPGEVWQVAFRATNPGWWANHCHNLPHADQGMMLSLAYDGVTTPYHRHH